MLSINETYVFMNFDLVVCTSLQRLIVLSFIIKWAMLTCSILEVCQEGGIFLGSWTNKKCPSPKQNK